MKVAVLSESSADEAAIAILAGGLCGHPVESIAKPPLRSRGWPSVRDVLAVVIKHLHYRTDAEGLIVVADSDGPIVHQHNSVGPARCDPGCRRCELFEICSREQQRLTAVAGRERLKIAIGLAVPAIEAWYRVGIDGGITEAAWIAGFQRVPPGPLYTKVQLKRAVYGTDRPSLRLETFRAKEEAQRLLTHIADLRTAFPGGFGCFAQDIERW